MTTYVLIHGAGGTAWSWHLVTEQLEARGHDVVAVNLPCDDDRAGSVEYPRRRARGDRRPDRPDRGRALDGWLHRAAAVRIASRSI